MDNINAADLVRAAQVVLLDFDGPVARLFGGDRDRRLADSLRARTLVEFPEDVARTKDPLAVLRWASDALNAEEVSELDAACADGEVELASDCDPTPGAFDFLGGCALKGLPVVIVSNNATAAIEAFLGRFHASHTVKAVIGRVPGRPDLMKPHPDSIDRALAVVGVPSPAAVFIGDSITDVVVSLRTGVPCLGFAKTPRRGRELHDAGAAALFDSMTELARALTLP